MPQNTSLSTPSGNDKHARGAGVGWFLRAYLCVALVFLALDALWLGWLARGFYQAQLGPMLLAQPRLGAALLFYLIYLFGLAYFCVLPGCRVGGAVEGMKQAAKRGVLFGVVAYATYDLTNLATLIGWTDRVVWVDVIWGGFESALACALAAAACAWWGRGRP